MRKRAAWHRLALAGLLLVTPSGCTKWSRPAPVAPELFQKSQVWETRVTMRDSPATLLLRNPVLTSDSLVGTGIDSTRVAVALGDVQELSVRRSDLLRSSALVVGGLIGAFFTFLLVLGAGMSG